MYALINPQEFIKDHQGMILGIRIIDVQENKFVLPEPLFWLECDEQVNFADWYVPADCTAGSNQGKSSFLKIPFPDQPPMMPLLPDVAGGPKVVAD